MSGHPRDNADTVWAAPGQEPGGAGTFEDPYRTLAEPLECIRPGQTVVLKSGTYTGNLTIQQSGSLEHPLIITSDDHRDVRFEGASWFLYDVSDVVVTHLGFINVPRNAISVIGACERNRFANLRFLDCGGAHDTSCTLFFGGSGGACNLVEDCVFERSEQAPTGSATGVGACVGLMIGQGAAEAPLRDYIVRKNRFVNYTHGILVGSEETPGEYGHRIELNSVEACALDGILVKCGDIVVRGNTVKDCGRVGVAVNALQGCVVENNRILSSSTGILVSGSGHTVQNNCIIRCGSSAVHLGGIPSTSAPTIPAAILVESNSCIDCGTSPGIAAGVLIDAGVLCAVRRNLFHGTGAPYAVDDANSSSIAPARLIDDNLSSGGCGDLPGSLPGDAVFVDRDHDDYRTDSGYGAQGWMCTPEAPVPETVDEEIAREYSACLSEEADSTAEELIEQVNEEELSRRSLFFGNDDE